MQYEARTRSTRHRLITSRCGSDFQGPGSQFVETDPRGRSVTPARRVLRTRRASTSRAGNSDRFAQDATWNAIHESPLSLVLPERSGDRRPTLAAVSALDTTVNRRIQSSVNARESPDGIAVGRCDHRRERRRHAARPCEDHSCPARSQGGAVLTARRIRGSFSAAMYDAATTRFNKVGATILW